MFKENTDDDFIPAPKLTNGERYTGNQTYAGLGIVRFCPKCNIHKSISGGHIASIMGGRHWVCNLHPKKVKK